MPRDYYKDRDEIEAEVEAILMDYYSIQEWRHYPTRNVLNEEEAKEVRKRIKSLWKNIYRQIGVAYDALYNEGHREVE